MLDALVDAVALLLTQSRLGEELAVIQRTVQDIRGQITTIFRETIAEGDLDELKAIEQSLKSRLDEVYRTCCDERNPALRDHVEYCLREVLVCFELARQVCTQHTAPDIRYRLLADLPILRPFDYFSRATD